MENQSTQTLFRELEAVVGAGNVLRDEQMNVHTTFKVGGPADFFVEPSSADQVVGIVKACRTADVELYVLGCGSNVLVADGGVRGVVMKLGANVGAIEVREDGTVTAQAGATNARIAWAALEAGLTGFEFAAGIPGSIGGAAIMNAGAYDGELRQVATAVTCLAPCGDVKRLTNEQAGWGYRHSSMMDDGSIVLEVDLQLSAGNPEDIRARMMELARRRADKQPLDLPSAGSTFKRPPGHFAGKLIQDAGMQGHTVGGAQVSTKHAGFVVNTGSATASDIKQVIDDVRTAVLTHFQVELQPEVRMWGF